MSSDEAAHTRRACHPALDNIQLVAFDLDGTLIDSVPDLAVAVDAALGEHGQRPVGVDKVRDWVGNGSRKLVERALAHALATAPERLEPEAVETVHARFLDHYAEKPHAQTTLYDGVRQCLSALATRSVTCVLITNKPIAFVGPILSHFELADFFALTLGGDSLDEKKPHPAPLLHAAQHTSTAPAKALMVGDSRHDIAAGKAAGFRTLAVTYGYNHGEPIAACRPDHIVTTLAELG